MRIVSAFIFFISIGFASFGQTAATSKASFERGKTAYEMYCLACHQADGSGVPSLNPPLIKTKWTQGDKKTIINVVLKGLDEEIEVDGESYHNIMPSMAHLTDEEIADILTFVRGSFGNKASAITVKDVKEQREGSK